MKSLNCNIKIYNLKLGKLIIFCLLLMILSTSCEDFVDIDPPRNQIIRETIYTDDESAMAAIIGIYSEMTNESSIITTQSNLFEGWCSDEFFIFSFSAPELEFFNNELTSTNSIVGGNWDQAYKFIHYSNAVLEGLAASENISEITKQQLTGEARFIRALTHFYLVNVFGDVPVITTTDFKVNSVASRNSKQQIYAQIISDLEEAQILLNDDYSFSNGERIRPNRWVATALLARVYLYLDDWANAEEQATAIINNSLLYSLESDLNAVFLANSNEAIWQLKPNAANKNAEDGFTFIPANFTLRPFKVSLNDQLINVFEAGDARLNNWVGSYDVDNTTYYFPFKYKVRESSSITEYNMIFRLAEQFLIRAEARANQNKISEAIDDLNIIRARAGLSNLSASLEVEQMLLAVAQERRIELFAEGGHRWRDLKRTGQANTVLASSKPSWQTTDELFPIPQLELEKNPNLTQNQGY